MTTAPSSPEVTPAAEGSAPTASPAHSLLVSAKDLAEWAAVSVVADGSTNRNLGSVAVSLAAGELRGVATDAKMLAVSRLFDRSQPAAQSASDSSGNRLHAVPSKPALRPAGHVGITSFRPHIEVAVTGDRFAQIATFAKELAGDALVEVEVASHRLGLSAGAASLSLPVVSQNYPNYQRIFSDITASSRGGDPAPLNVNAEQLVQLLRSAGLRTAPLRRRAHLHVEGFTKKGSDRPVPLRVDILTEEELFGSYRRWVGVVAPIIL